jgi:hypothetical protein
MHLIDVNRRFQRRTAGLTGHPQAVVPLIVIQTANDGGGIRRLTGAEANGVHLMDTAAGPVMDQVLVGLSLLGIGGPYLPDTVGDLVHVQVFAVPVVEVAYNTDSPGVGRPNTEHKAVNTVPIFGMAAQEFVRTCAGPGVIIIQEGGKFFGHCFSFPFLYGVPPRAVKEAIIPHA